MADDYSFKEAFTDAEKVRRALEVGTDGSGNPILLPMVSVGDETTAGQEADSQVAADLLERFTAVVDALNSGQADDELRIDIQAQSAGIAENATIADQSSYDGVLVGPTQDTTFSPPYNAILLASVDGDISIETGDGNDVTIPQGALTAGQPFQVTVAQVNSTGTTQTVADIVLLRE